MKAEGILIGAGAGMGVDSGLPDFRGPEGFWKAYPPIAKLGLRFEQMANPHWFTKDPELAWGFYGHRLNLYRNTTPHEGFGILKRWVNDQSIHAFVYTSNVDGHFQRAGFEPEEIIECHGSLNHLQCLAECGQAIWSADESQTPKEPLIRFLPVHPAGNLPDPTYLCSETGVGIPKEQTVSVIDS